jgi:hypothetical protein
MKKFGKTYVEKKKLQILVTRNSQNQANFHHFLPIEEIFITMLNLT